MISKSEIQRHLTASIPLYVFDIIDSTNSFAKKLEEDFALVVADCQSSGRGRLGREFYSPKGSGIYFTLKVKNENLYQNVPFITTLASVAVHQAVKTLCNTDCGIKWVNDIYINNKKVSGILCEIVDETHAVIGIGINFYKSALPENLKNIATSLFDDTSPVTREELIAYVADNLFRLLSKLPDTSFMEYYKSNSIVLGKKVLCITGEQSFEATATDITPQGALVVQAADGMRTLSSGEITLRFS